MLKKHLKMRQKSNLCRRKEKNPKPMVEIIGELSYDLQKGYRAFIRKSDGELLMTSQVLDIRGETTNSVEIETQNTIYKLTYATVQTAA